MVSNSRIAFQGQRGELASLLDTHVGTMFRRVWRGTNTPLSVCPQEGLLVLFPAWLPHSEQGLTTDGMRIRYVLFSTMHD